MFDKYILKGKTPIRMRNILEWSKWLETADLTVKKTQVGKVDISTVFLGTDHQFGTGPPLLFETMIFGGDHDEDMWRYSTWEEAEAGHDRVVAELSGEAIDRLKREEDSMLDKIRRVLLELLLTAIERFVALLANKYEGLTELEAEMTATIASLRGDVREGE